MVHSLAVSEVAPTTTETSTQLIYKVSIMSSDNSTASSNHAQNKSLSLSSFVYDLLLKESTDKGVSVDDFVLLLLIRNADYEIE